MEEKLNRRLTEIQRKLDDLATEQKRLNRSLNEVKVSLSQKIDHVAEDKVSTADLEKQFLDLLTKSIEKYGTSQGPSVCQAPKTAKPKANKSKTRKPVKTWNIIEIETPDVERLTPAQLIPVEGGVWVGGRMYRLEPIAFFDFEKNGITLLLDKGGTSWSAIGYDALVVRHDRQGLIQLNAQHQQAAIWDKKPETCHFLDYVKTYSNHFYLPCVYGPIWIYEPQSDTLTNIQLEYVRDADFPHLGTGYYRPSLGHFVLGKDGEIWGFQGTFDASRGNAVCHFIPETKTWEHFEFPWETARGDDHWPIGVADNAVWFSSRRSSILLFDKKTHRWKKLEAALPSRRSSPITFCESGVFVACGNRLFEFQEVSSVWKDLQLGDFVGQITGIAEKDGTLYLATESGLQIYEDFRNKGASQPSLLSWRVFPETKSFALVQSTHIDPNLIHVDKLCKAVKRGAIEEVKALLKMGLDVNATTDPSGLTPLHLAASEGHLDVVKLLLEFGADINARNMSRFTPLRMAVMNQHIEVADYLMSVGGTR